MIVGHMNGDCRKLFCLQGTRSDVYLISSQLGVDSLGNCTHFVNGMNFVYLPRPPPTRHHDKYSNYHDIPVVSRDRNIRLVMYLNVPTVNKDFRVGHKNFPETFHNLLCTFSHHTPYHVLYHRKIVI